MQRGNLSGAAIKELPITWHATTARNFQCQSGCVCCCTATLFFPSEAERCPAEIQDVLEWRMGYVRPQRRPPGVCVFFDEDSAWHCRISEYRPLRCRLYPYLPVVTNDEIVIIADPLFTISFPETDSPEWYRCYGLGCGSSVQSSIEQMSREFLERVIEEYPSLIDTLFIADVDHYLNPREVEKALQPQPSQWEPKVVHGDGNTVFTE